MSDYKDRQTNEGLLKALKIAEQALFKYPALSSFAQICEHAHRRISELEKRVQELESKNE